MLTSINAMNRMMRAGRTKAPGILLDLVETGELERPDLGIVACYAWSVADRPDENLDIPTWVDIFREAGLTRDGEPVDRPIEPMRLYRGATAARRRRMAWTTNRRMAEFYAYEYNLRDRGTVWTTTVDPGSIVAFIDGREEFEVVIDPRGILIEGVQR